MGLEDMKNFLTLMETDPAIKAKVLSLPTADDVADLALMMGFEFSGDMFLQASGKKHAQATPSFEAYWREKQSENGEHNVADGVSHSEAGDGHNPTLRPDSKRSLDIQTRVVPSPHREVPPHPPSQPRTGDDHNPTLRHDSKRSPHIQTRVVPPHQEVPPHPPSQPRIHEQRPLFQNTTDVPADGKAAYPFGFSREQTPPSLASPHYAITRRTQMEITELRALRNVAISKEEQELKLLSEREVHHWEKQEEKVKLLVVRLQNGANTCRQLHTTLERSSKLLSLVASTVDVEGEATFAVKETGTLAQAALAHGTFGKTTASYIKEIQARVFRESLQVADGLAREAQREVSRVSAAASKELDAVKAQRARTKRTLADYEKAVQERHQAERQNRAVLDDPFLHCRAFDLESMRQRQVEAEAQKALSALFLDARLQDARRVDSVKSVLLDNLLAQRAILEHALKFLNTTIDAVKNIDREVDVEHWVREGGFMCDIAPTPTQPVQSRPFFETPTPPSASDCISRIFQLEVESKGSLMRPKTIIRGWTGHHVVLSKSGQLHVFPDLLSPHVLLTIPLHECKLRAAAEVDPDVFELALPSHGLFSSLLGGPSLYLFKAHSVESMKAWMSAITKYLPPDGVTPTSRADDDDLPPGI
eukprot:g25945.t1